MSRNGSGTYSLPAGNPVVTGTTISSTWANNTLSDIASALTGSVASDGQTPMTGQLDMNSNKIKNVADPTLAQDAATKNYSDTTYLAKASNLSDVANATTARTNISAAKSGANSDITSLTGLTTPLSQSQGGTGTTTGYYGFKNRIINGAMVIDQRNAGASGTASGYNIDRWAYYPTQSSRFTWQQNAGSVTPPVGFTNYLGFTSSSSYSVLSTDYFIVAQSIEGLNLTDMGFGTANAVTFTVSFWVRSSLTGTFGGAICNGANDRSYPFSYTISSANTWEQKSVTIAGDTTGTWLRTNATGLNLYFNLGAGSSNTATAGAWTSGFRPAPTGATSVVGTNGATFYITGVQLEVGSNATSFDYRPYGTELQLCQRYFYRSGSTTSPSGFTGPLVVVTTVAGRYPSWLFPQIMRAAPTITATYQSGGTGATFEIGSAGMFQTTNHTTDTAFGFTANIEL